MRTVFYFVLFSVLSGNLGAQSRADSLINKLQDKNLNALNHQLVLLASHPIRESVTMNRREWPEIYSGFAHKAVERSKTMSNDARVIILSHTADVMVREGNIVEGYSWANESLKLAEANKTLWQSYAFRKYSDILNTLNYLDSSLFYSEKMLDVAREFHNDSTEREALYQLGSQFYRIRNYAKSELFLKKLVAHPLTTDRAKMDYYNTIALTYRGRKMYDTAIAWFNRSLVQAILLRDTAWIGLTHGNIGYSNYLAGRRDVALPDLLLDLHDSFKKQSYRSGLSALTTIISIYLEEGNIPEAKRYYDTLAVNLYRAQDAENMLDFLTISTDIYEKTGNPTKALQFARARYRYADSLSNVRNIEKAAELEAQFDFNRQFRTIQSLEQRNVIQEASNRAKNYLLAGTSIFILLGVGFIYVLQRSNRFKFETNQILQEQNIKISQQASNLNELNATKDKLLSIISHDLRGPVNSLKALISMASKQIISPEEFTHFLGQLEKNVETVNFTLDNVLFWSRAQLHGIQTKPVSIGMADLIDETFKLFSDLVIAKGITVENSVSAGIQVFADPDQLRLVLRNLISNGIKFTNTGGKITISSTARKEQEIISVRDTGVGMSKEVAADLFTSHQGMTTTGTGGEKGTGLGLSLCREMIERNNGRIWVESTPGQGTTFYFSLIRTS